MKSTGTDGKYTVELEKILNSDGTTFYDPETSNVDLSDIFGAKQRMLHLEHTARFRVVITMILLTIISM